MRAIRDIGILVLVIAVMGCYGPVTAQDEKPAEQPKQEVKPAPAPAQPAQGTNAAPAPAPAQPAQEIKPAPAPVPTANAPTLKIGVVNLVEVFGRYEKTKDYEKVLEREKQKEEAAIKELESQIKKLDEEMDALSKTSELYLAKKEALSTATAQREYKVKNWNDYIKNRIDEQTIKIYKDIREAVDMYARENGFSFIFKSDPLTPSSDDVNQQINVRSVLYFPKSADITEDIIKILNKEK